MYLGKRTLLDEVGMSQTCQQQQTFLAGLLSSFDNEEVVNEVPSQLVLDHLSNGHNVI